MRECPKHKQGGGIQSIEFNLHQYLHQIGLHLWELLRVQAEEQTACMLLLIALNKRIHQMASLV